MRSRTTSFALGLGLTLAISCSSPVDMQPTVEGTISQLATDPITILVDPDSSGCGYLLLVDSETRVETTTVGGRVTVANSSVLQVGRAVRVWADGAMLLGCPARGRAMRVRTIEP